MGRDYYAVLGVPRNASSEDVRKAYKKQARMFHPDKNKNQGAEEKFKEISEAYKVLTDPNRREIFDMWGEDGLAGNIGSRNDFFMDPMKVFKDAFGDEDPFKEFNSFFFDDLGDFCNFSKVFETSTSSSTSGGWKSFGESFNYETSDPFMKHETTLPQDPPIEQPLHVTLEELFTGSVKKLRINHQVLSPTGGYLQEEKILQIDVKPGWKEGTKITFQNEGDMKPGVIAADIIFMITDKPHQYFKRDAENNLLYVAKLNLREALVGCMINVPTIDGRVLSIQVNEVIQPGTQKRIPGEGMPLSKRNGERGDMIVAFDVAFPTNLSNEQKEFLATLPF